MQGAHRRLDFDNGWRPVPECLVVLLHSPEVGSNLLVLLLEDSKLALRCRELRLQSVGILFGGRLGVGEIGSIRLCLAESLAELCVVGCQGNKLGAQRILVGRGLAVLALAVLELSDDGTQPAVQCCHIVVRPVQLLGELLHMLLGLDKRQAGRSEVVLEFNNMLLKLGALCLHVSELFLQLVALLLDAVGLVGDCMDLQA